MKTLDAYLAETENTEKSRVVEIAKMVMVDFIMGIYGILVVVADDSEEVFFIVVRDCSWNLKDSEQVLHFLNLATPSLYRPPMLPNQIVERA